MKKIFLFASALLLSATLFAQEETELFNPANASFNEEKTFGQFVKPEATWDATTGTFTVVIKQQSEWQWGNQVFLNTGISTLGTNKEYQVSFDIVASTPDCGGVTFKAFDDNQIAFANQNINVTDQVQTWTSEWTVPGAEAANGLIVWDFGWDPVQTITITNISIKERESQAPPVPEVLAPNVPTVAAENVKAIMCDVYENNLGWWPQGWGGCNWVDTCLAGANFFYANTMAWDCFAGDWNDAFVGDYKNLHFDIWFAEDGNAPIVKLEFNDELPTEEITIPGEYTAGWNSVNINVEEIFGEQQMNSLKCLTVKVTKEGGPVAWANFLFFNGEYSAMAADGICDNTPGLPTEAPTTPTVTDATSVLGVAMEKDLAFAFIDWAAIPKKVMYGDVPVDFFSNMTWTIYTNWAEDYYDMSEYNMLHFDLYPTVDSKIKITLENLSVDDGGNGYKNGVVKEMKANVWNALDINVKDFPDVNEEVNPFEYFKYFILEGFMKSDDTSAEGTPLSIGNVYFYTSGTGLENIENVKAPVKSIRNGQIVIERNDIRYNMMGAIVK